MEERMIAIEEKLAHLERQFEELDGVVRDLFDRLDAAHGHIKRVEALVESRSWDDPGDNDDESLRRNVPPHSGG